VAAFADREVNAVEADVGGSVGQGVALQELQELGEKGQLQF